MQTIETSAPNDLPECPKVSIIMLAYQHANFIKNAIEGAITQECDFSFELIIGEDHSTDRTLDIALDYQRRYPHIIRILSSASNVGMQANNTRCLAAARGEFVAYCEGDDYWCDPTKLTRQVAVMRLHPECSLVFHAAMTKDVRTQQVGITAKWSPYPRFFGAEDVILGDGGFIPTASMMLRRSKALLKLPPWVASAVVPDYALALWCTLVGKVAYIDRPMSVYRTSVAASWSTRHLLELSHRIKHARKIERMFKNFIEASGHRYHAEATRMISKYYSDALVRIPAERGEASRIYRTYKRKMIGSDRVLAWLSAEHGLRFPGLKSLIRKVHSLTRLSRSMLTNDRIST